MSNVSLFISMTDNGWESVDRTRRITKHARESVRGETKKKKENKLTP